MNPGVCLLCALLSITAAGCDRVYVHPFFLISYNGTCKQPEDRDLIEKTLVPGSNKSELTSDSEEGHRNKSKEDVQQSEVDYLKDLAYVFGGRFYKVLRKTHKDENIIFSPTNMFESFVFVYLGASGQQAINLLHFLGLELPSDGPDCAYTIDDPKVVSALKIINSPFLSKEVDGVVFSKLLCLFTASDIQLPESFVHKLAFSDLNYYIQAVNFTNPIQAAEQIKTFVEGKISHQSTSLTTDIDPTANLLFATYTQFKATVKGAYPRKQPQEFWLSADTKVLVPMMSVTGTFKHKSGHDLSVIKMVVSKSIFLLLLLPTNNTDLSNVEAQYLLPTSAWLQNLAPRQIHLTLPKVSFESIYNFQELLVKLGLSQLLGEKGNLKLNNTNLVVGKIINQQLFELSPSGEEQAEDHSEHNESIETLTVTLNKPFLIAAFQEETNALLYFGRITNPLKTA